MKNSLFSSNFVLVQYYLLSGAFGYSIVQKTIQVSICWKSTWNVDMEMNMSNKEL